MKEYSQEELNKLFDNLPKELRSVILSEETADRVEKMSERYGIKDNNVSLLAKMVGRILMGLLPPEEFPSYLQAELSLSKKDSEDLSREVNRFILFPVKGILKNLYEDIEFEPGGRIGAKERKKEPKKRKEEKHGSEDRYREPIGEE